MTETEETELLDVKDCTSAFEEAHAKRGKEIYVLRLYVAGMGPKSMQAINNIKSICEEHLPGKCQLEVINIYQDQYTLKMAR
jgi:circadian clock protein KaiB